MMPSPASLSRIGILLAAGATTPALARPDVIPSVTASVGVAYSSNPFLQRGPTRSGSGLTVDIAPSLEIIDARTRAAITANVGRSQYLDNVGNSTGYRLQSVVSHRAADRLTLNAQLGFDSSILGARSQGLVVPGAVTVPVAVEGTGSTPGTAATTGGVGPLPGTGSALGLDALVGGIGTTVVDSDLALLGTRQRRNLLSASAGVDFRPSARSTWSFGVNGARATFPDATLLLNSYTSYGAQLGYSRALSETRSIGVGLGVSSVDYARTGTTTIFSPRVSYVQRIRGGWTLTGSVGAALVREGGASATSLSGEVSLCRTALRSALCLSASRQPSVTGLGNVGSQTAIGASYSYRLAERTTLSASAGYSQLSAQSFAVLGVPTVRAAQGFLTSDLLITRQFSRRLSGFVGIAYRDLYSRALTVSADYGVRAGVAVTIGRRR